VSDQKGIVDIYDGLIPNLLSEGHSLRDVGKRTGVSYERIRQVREKYYPGTERAVMFESELARRLGRNVSVILKWRLAGKLSPERMGHRWIYNAAEIAKAEKLAAESRTCKQCGGKIVGRNVRYCDGCGREHRRYNYPFLPDEQKARCSRAARDWQRRHPERARVMLDRAAKRFIEKRRVWLLANARYIVIRKTKGCGLSEGAVVRPIGFAKGIIILEGNIRMPNFFIRRLE